MLPFHTSLKNKLLVSPPMPRLLGESVFCLAGSLSGSGVLLKLSKILIEKPVVSKQSHNLVDNPARVDTCSNPETESNTLWQQQLWKLCCVTLGNQKRSRHGENVVSKNDYQTFNLPLKEQRHHETTTCEQKNGSGR